ncbi:MAG: radical SAM protein [Oscillospiraceae bacterium]|nr:radical SAM protein [Oscillospiraceae bacterium]
MLKKVYIEITNCCNLSCVFCPGTKRKKHFMTAEEFAAVLRNIRGQTEYIYFHVMGEPLLHPQLKTFLSMAGEAGFKVCITTNGTLLDQAGEILLSAPGLHKISISLHSLEGNGSKQPLLEYLESCWDFCEKAVAKGIICALRLWNEGGANEENEKIEAFLHEKTEGTEWAELRFGSKKLAEKIYLENAARFDWPDMTAEKVETQFCYALRDQAGILADGTVIPCCLDHEGDIPLGNIFEHTLGEILASPRAKALYDGFSARRPSE